MIRDISKTTMRAGERDAGNAIQKEIANTKRSLEFALKQAEKGKDTTVLVEHYQKRLATLLKR